VLACRTPAIGRLAVQKCYQRSYLPVYFCSLHNIASTDNVDYFERIGKEATLFVYIIAEFSLCECRKNPENFRVSLRGGGVEI